MRQSGEPQGVQIIRQGKPTPYYCNFNPLYNTESSLHPQRHHDLPPHRPQLPPAAAHLRQRHRPAPRQPRAGFAARSETGRHCVGNRRTARYCARQNPAHRNRVGRRPTARYLARTGRLCRTLLPLPCRTNRLHRAALRIERTQTCRTACTAHRVRAVRRRKKAACTAGTAHQTGRLLARLATRRRRHGRLEKHPRAGGLAAAKIHRTGLDCPTRKAACTHPPVLPHAE